MGLAEVIWARLSRWKRRVGGGECGFISPSGLFRRQCSRLRLVSAHPCVYPRVSRTSCSASAAKLSRKLRREYIKPRAEWTWTGRQGRAQDLDDSIGFLQRL